MVLPERAELRVVSSRPEIVPGISFIPDFDVEDKPDDESRGVMADRTVVRENWSRGCGYLRKNARLMLIGQLFDWGQDEFELTLREIAQVLRKASPRSVIASRRALRAGQLIDKHNGTWALTKSELVAVMAGAFAYSYHWRGQKKQQASEPAPV